MAYLATDALQFLTGDRLPVQRATSFHLSGLYPLQVESGLIDPRTGAKVPGLPVGYAGRNRSGGVFQFDQVQLYQTGLISNTNKKIFGEIGARKSTGVKCEIYRGCAIGYNHLVTDRKGEYTPLAKAIPGSKVLRFGEDTELFINALDPSMDAQTQNDLVAAMALTALGGDRIELNIVEKALLWEAIRASHEGPSGAEAVLPDTVRYLFEPSEGMSRAMHRPREVVKEQGYQLALALQRLTDTDLRGMFHRPTTPGLLTETPLMVLNCEKLKGEAAVVMITLLNFFTQSQWGRRDAGVRYHKVFHDEAWDLAAYPGFVESIRRAFKLSGTWGVSNTIVAHHKSNMDRSGNNPAIKDLIADSETTVFYRQDEAELRASADELGVTEAEIKRIIQLPPGTAIYKIGSMPGIEIEQVVWPEERPLVETRHLLKGEQSDLPRAALQPPSEGDEERER